MDLCRYLRRQEEWGCAQIVEKAGRVGVGSRLDWWGIFQKAGIVGCALLVGRYAEYRSCSMCLISG